MSKQQKNKYQGKYNGNTSQNTKPIKNNTGPDGQENWNQNASLQQKPNSPKKGNPKKETKKPVPPKKATKKTPPFDTHQRFFESAGFDIYEYARSQQVQKIRE
jgi:hypothetical protein